MDDNPKPIIEMSDAEIGMLMVELTLQARSFMEQPGSIIQAESKFTAACLQILSIKHHLDPDETLRWAKRIWAEARNQGPITKKQRKSSKKRIPDEEQSDYMAGNTWVFDDSLDLTNSQKSDLENTMFVDERVVAFGTDAHDDTLAAEHKIGSDGRSYILVRRATIDEEASLLGLAWPKRRSSDRAKRYSSRNGQETITPGKLRRLVRAEQTATMKAWFSANYEVPTDSTPWDEDESAFVGGGPYRAVDALWNELQAVIPEFVIKDLADELEETSREWVPINGSEAEGARIATGANTRATNALTADLIRLIHELKTELGRIEPLYYGIGHNNPPEDSRLLPINPEDHDRVSETIDELEGQAKSSTPDEDRVRTLLSVLKSAAAKTWSIAKRKVDKATDKISENMGLALIASGAAPDLYHWVQRTALVLNQKMWQLSMLPISG